MPSPPEFRAPSRSLPASYAPFLDELKSRVRQAQLRAVSVVNRELVMLYWHIGRRILDAQKSQGWGAKIVDRLAGDLALEFPEMRGFSRANLLHMRSFAKNWPEESIVQQVVGQLPWGTNLLLLRALKDPSEREWYATKALQHGWSRATLEIQIDSRLHAREGKAITNFSRTLPPEKSDLARQMLKDPYLSAVDDQFRRSSDGQTIGLILAKSRNGAIVECALRDIVKPIAVATWTSRILDTMPAKLRDALSDSDEGGR